MAMANQISGKGDSVASSGDRNGRGKQKPRIFLQYVHCMLVMGVSMLVIVGAESSYPTTSHTPIRDPNEFRLPTDLVPTHYDLTLQPNIYSDDPRTFTFDGSVVIHIMCKTTTDKIVLNSRQLTYSDRSMSLMYDDGASHMHMNPVSGPPPTIVSHTFDRRRNFLTLHLDSNLITGRNYSVSLVFSGRLRKDNSGLYLSSYKTGNRTVYLATSQLEPTDARKVFPCFDEPALKATFTTSLIRKSHMTSLSNMERVSETPMANGWVKDTYNRTVRMSTYILAFVVCDFTSASARIEEDGVNVLVTVWTRPEYIAQADYALRAAVQLLPILQEYMGIPYPLTKLEMVAVPDFRFGAMENWGLVIYGEHSMLYEPNVSTIEEKMWVARIVAHEIAHMWYGNYVTMSWWDDLWLNEGFATFMAIMAVDKFEPTWHYMDRFRTHITERALREDAHASYRSHPLYVPLYDANDATHIFDTITYQKGAHVIKMMQSFVSFRDGLRRYLDGHAYGDVTHADLWKAMSVGSRANVSRVMATWVNQMNFPLVTLKRTYNGTSGTGTQLTVRQERYLQAKDEPESTKYTSEFGYRWIIPVNMITRENASHVTRPIWLEEESKTFEIQTKLSQNDWILGNAGNDVLCRVNYDLDNWRLLGKQLKEDHTVISLADRLSLIYDACTLARAGHINITTCLDIASYFDKETEYLPLKAAIPFLLAVGKQLPNNAAAQHDFLELMTRKVAAVYANIPPLAEITDANDLQKAGYMSNVACSLDNPKCLKNMYNEFKKRRDVENYQIKPEVRDDVLRFGIKQGTPSDWREVYDTLEHIVHTSREMGTVLSALGHSRDPGILNEYLNKSMKMNSYVANTVTQAVANNGGRAIAFNFFRDNVHAYFRRFDTHTLGEIIQTICGAFNTPDELQQFEDLVTSLPDRRSVAWALDIVRAKINANIAWVDTNEKTIADWLKTQTNPRLDQVIRKKIFLI